MHAAIFSRVISQLCVKENVEEKMCAIALAWRRISQIQEKPGPRQIHQLLLRGALEKWSLCDGSDFHCHQSSFALGRGVNPTMAHLLQQTETETEKGSLRLSFEFFFPFSTKQKRCGDEKERRFS